MTVADLSQPSPGVVDLAGGHAERSPGRPIPPADVLIWHAGRDARVMIRPSGTEPELKIYTEAVCPVHARAGLQTARRRAAERIEQMLSDATAALGVASSAGGSASSKRKGPS